MKFIVVFLLSIMSFTASAQKLKKTSDYERYYKPLFDSLLSSRWGHENSIILFQDNIVRLRKHEFGHYNVQTILSYISENYNISDSNFLMLYENWILNSKEQFQNYLKGGISEKKKTKIQRRTAKQFEKREQGNKNAKLINKIIITIAPPFFINKNTVMLQFNYHCYGTCDTFEIYIMKHDESTDTYKVDFGGAIHQQ